ncbi:MAG: metalloregulator ArsR/SmtB family transcription factor [Syntrophobacterales bacterium]
MVEQSRDLCDCRLIHRRTVEKAIASALAPNETESLAQIFKALADETRLKILWALEQREMCVCDLAAMLGLTESAVSHQLRLLRNLQLVSNRRDGVVLYYRLSDNHVSQLIKITLEHLRD